MFFIGGFAIQLCGFAIFLSFAVTTDASTPPRFQFKYPAIPEISQAGGNILPATHDPGDECRKVRGRPHVRNWTLVAGGPQVGCQIANL